MLVNQRKLKVQLLQLLKLLQHYITGTDESSKFLINELPVYCNLQEINISTDCCFTSVSLAKWALYKNITIISTMKHDQKGIPKKLKPVADREERSVMHVYNTKEKIMLVSYTDKKSGEKKL